jgi:hypothetical protein
MESVKKSVKKSELYFYSMLPSDKVKCVCGQTLKVATLWTHLRIAEKHDLSKHETEVLHEEILRKAMDNKGQLPLDLDE